MITYNFNNIWKPINGYEGLYKISNTRKVKSIDRIVYDKNNKPKSIKGGIVKEGNNGNEYKFCYLWKDNKSQRFYIHRLVAETFIPNPNNYKEINHINKNRSDNRVENLEWCTAKYNKTYSLGIKIVRNDGIVYNSMVELAEILNVKLTSIKWHFNKYGIYKHTINNIEYVYKRE